MLTLKGTLRQAGAIKTKEGQEFKKLWVEHETPADGDRVGDLQILEFLVPSKEVGPLPPHGDPISLDVRAYVRGRDIAYKALRVLPAGPVHETTSKAVASK